MSAAGGGNGPEAAGGVWDEIHRRVAELERAQPAAEDLAALWRERAVELARASDREAERGDAVKAVVVRLGHDRYGIRVTSVVEIQKLGRLTRVPGAPAHVCGVINLRGLVLTVLDLRPLLGASGGAPGERARILVAEGAGMTVGLLAEEVEEILEVAAAEVKPPLAGLRGPAEDYVAGIVAHRGQMVVLLELERVLRAPRLAVDETV